MAATATATAFSQDSSAAALASDLVKALNHEIRRSILRFLLKTAPANSAEIRHGISGSVGNNLNFHLDILVATGAVIREAKRVGYRERFYFPSSAIQARWFLTVLHLTAGED